MRSSIDLEFSSSSTSLNESRTSAPPIGALKCKPFLDYMTDIPTNRRRAQREATLPTICYDLFDNFVDLEKY